MNSAAEMCVGSRKSLFPGLSATLALVGLCVMAAAWLLAPPQAAGVAAGVLLLAIARTRAVLDRHELGLRSIETRLAGCSATEVRGTSGSTEQLAQLTAGVEQRLREREDEVRTLRGRLDTLLGTVPDAVFGLDADMCVVFANPAVTALCGLELDRASGVAFSALFPECTAEWIQARLDGAAVVSSTGMRVARSETEGIRGGDTRFPVEVSIAQGQSAGDIRYVCVVRDLAERRWAEDQMRLFNRALDATTNGVLIASMTWPGAPVVYANPAFESLTGYENGEIIGMNCRVLQGNDTDQPALDTLRAAMKAGRSTRVTLRNYRKDGTPFVNELTLSPVTDHGGALTHYVGVLNDVTQREAARRALADRSARLDAIFKLSPDGFVLFDSTGWLAYGNPAFYEMTGWLPKHTIGVLDVDAFEHLFEEHCDPAFPYQRLIHDGQQDDSPALLRLIRPSRRVLSRTVRHTLAESGETILYFRDVTRETEVDRMKSEFLTTAAHELRTPMASIFGFSELLLRREVTVERRREMVETIHRQASWLIHMLNELLDLARIEARQGKDLLLEPVPIRALVEDVLATLMVPGDPRQVQIVGEISAQSVTVDAEKTRQALINVLSNAYKYSPDGGAIELWTVSRSDEQGRMQCGVAIRDHGIGMTPDQVRRIGERFYRADPSGNVPGTGLGMALVREIMGLQGGALDIDSEYGRGTTITLWLPAWPARQDTLGSAGLESNEEVQPCSAH
ncbi:MAG TPA: PAS domain-containing protein [Burkholderiaceae bacterium]|nr:PAS domain-containing protein [Burkholderiaceae bacterium]